MRSQCVRMTLGPSPYNGFVMTDSMGRWDLC